VLEPPELVDPEIPSLGIGSFGPCDATLLSNSDGRLVDDCRGGNDAEVAFICAFGLCAGMAGGGIRCACSMLDVSGDERFRETE